MTAKPTNLWGFRNFTAGTRICDLNSHENYALYGTNKKILTHFSKAQNECPNISYELTVVMLLV